MITWNGNVCSFDESDLGSSTDYCLGDLAIELTAITPGDLDCEHQGTSVICRYTCDSAPIGDTADDIEAAIQSHDSDVPQSCPKLPSFYRLYGKSSSTWASKIQTINTQDPLLITNGLAGRLSDVSTSLHNMYILGHISEYTKNTVLGWFSE